METYRSQPRAFTLSCNLTSVHPTHREHVSDSSAQRMVDRAMFEQRVFLDESRDRGVIGREREEALDETSDAGICADATWSL